MAQTSNIEKPKELKQRVMDEVFRVKRFLLGGLGFRVWRGASCGFAGRVLLDFKV